MLGIYTGLGLIVCYFFGTAFFFIFRNWDKRILHMRDIFIGIIFLAGGFGGTYGLYIENTDLLNKMPWCAFGTVPICMSIFDLIKIRMCRTQIYGVFVKDRQLWRSGLQMTIPTFQYFYDGFYYEDESEEEIPEYKEKNYKSGHKYPIYICEKAPYLFITDRSNYGLTIFRFTSGVIIIAAVMLAL